MALLVWLPLNGNLKNQGVSDVTVTNNGATIDNGGKIGQCYYFNGSAQYLQFNQTLANLYTSDFSWAMWLKPTDDTRSALISEYSSTGASNVALELHNNRKLRIWWNGNPDYYPNYYVPKDEWTHLVVTKTNNLLKVYINGELIEQKSATLPARTSSSKIRIGDDYRGGTTVSYQGYLNDVRIYDHCLSPAEIKELSRGLVLHYKLDNNYSDDYSITEPDGTKWTHIVHHNNPTNSGLFSSTDDFENGVYIDQDRWFNACKTLRKLNGFEIMVKQALTSGATETKYRWIQKKSPLIATYDEVAPSTVTRITTTGYTNGNQGGLYNKNTQAFFCIANATSGNWFGAFGSWTYYNNGVPAYPSNTVTTGYMDLYVRTDIVYDSSGFGNNACILGIPTLSTDSPRYSKSMTFTNGKNQHLVSATLYTTAFQDSYTISWWSKSSAMASKMAWGSNGGNRLNLFPSGTNFYWNTGDGTNNPIVLDGSNITFSAYNNNVWHHYVMTGDGTTGKLYIDGVLRGTATTYQPFTASCIYISGWDSSSSYTWSGSVSDFRIYSTVFSADDVLQLYKVSGKIDNLGNIHSYEINEATTDKTKLFKTGVFKTEELKEGNSKAEIEETVSINVNEFIEI